jgi:hypothetical protein
VESQVDRLYFRIDCYKLVVGFSRLRLYVNLRS